MNIKNNIIISINNINKIIKNINTKNIPNENDIQLLNIMVYKTIIIIKLIKAKYQYCFHLKIALL